MYWNIGTMVGIAIYHLIIIFYLSIQAAPSLWPIYQRMPYGMTSMRIQPMAILTFESKIPHK